VIWHIRADPPSSLPQLPQIHLALAHDRGVEVDFASAIDAGLAAGELPNLAVLRRRFTPTTTAAPEVIVIPPPLAAYDRLIAGAEMEMGAEFAP
jgi:hypothetical protein